jgi:ubiquinol-cytochrome c reductase cytochrome b subunit
VSNTNLTRSEKLLEHLALDGVIARLRGLGVHRDGLTWNRFSGSLALVLVVLLFLSGAFMAFYYSSAPGAAYDSVDYALFSVPFGEMIRGVHFYAWNILLVLMGLHLARAFIFGAYKAPRQMIWVSGVIVMLIVPAFIITGDLLPWDQKGYWSTHVRTGIISSVPVIGDFLVRLLQGGQLTGIVTLTRFYVLHAIFLPVVLVILILVHFHFLYRRGISSPLSGNDAARPKVPFLPRMINRWLVLFLLATVILGLRYILYAQAGVVGLILKPACGNFHRSSDGHRNLNHSGRIGGFVDCPAVYRFFARAPSCQSQNGHADCNHNCHCGAGTIYNGIS